MGMYVPFRLVPSSAMSIRPFITSSLWRTPEF